MSRVCTKWYRGTEPSREWAYVVTGKVDWDRVWTGTCLNGGIHGLTLLETGLPEVYQQIHLRRPACRSACERRYVSVHSVRVDSGKINRTT